MLSDHELGQRLGRLIASQEAEGLSPAACWLAISRPRRCPSSWSLSTASLLRIASNR